MIEMLINGAGLATRQVRTMTSAQPSIPQHRLKITFKK